jgi:hypothetical protein
MGRNVYLALAMVLALGVGGAAAAGQAPESFLGVVKAVSGSSVTIERGSLSGTFNVTPATHVAVQGATAKTLENKRAGKAGLTVPDAVHIGDQVVVKFHETNGTMVATDIQVRVKGPLARANK